MTSATNILSIPAKRSTAADIRDALTRYIHEKHPETHPDAYSWDIDTWSALRIKAITEDTHESHIQDLLMYVSFDRTFIDSFSNVWQLTPYIRYHSQLVFAQTKLPDDVRTSYLLILLQRFVSDAST